MPARKVILYIAMSLDGLIAGPNDELDWLSVVEMEGEDYGYADFTAGVDTYIVGRRTYENVLKMTGGEFYPAEIMDCYVLTRQDRPNENGVQFYKGSVGELIANLRQRQGKHIYCDGGSQIVKLLMQEDLIDEYIVSVVPILLGNGIPLFSGGLQRMNLKLRYNKVFKSGLVQFHYERVR